MVTFDTIVIALVAALTGGKRDSGTRLARQ
jgi:hypothetical protein